MPANCASLPRPAVVVGRMTVEDFCHISIQIAGIHGTVLVDAGSSVKLVRPVVYQQATGRKWRRLEPIAMHIVTGGLSPMWGKGPMKIQVGATPCATRCEWLMSRPLHSGPGFPSADQRPVGPPEGAPPVPMGPSRHIDYPGGDC
ncbi:hypothetical protein EOD39_6472 [Acipenser ruthenus]|uniref:Peptidase A2 domain-containing protein n=1 Tax=Acipenser ruthenus TaxID=7906 RepID=A0A444UA09_ACIRT|nr:hypothetical protein EOD39_6472 [Acipenser ruthenus]